MRERATWRGPGTVRPWNCGAVRAQVVSLGAQDRELRAACCSTASSGLMSKRQRTWGTGPEGGSGGTQRPGVAHRGAMRPGPPRCGWSLMGCSSLARALSAGYEGSRRGDPSTRSARWASRPLRCSTGGEAGAVARPWGARGALLDRVRRRGSLSLSRARGGAGSGGGGSGCDSMVGSSSVSKKSKLRQWRLLKGVGAAGRATDRSHGWRLDVSPGSTTLMSWYTVDTSKSGGSVRVILKDVPRLAAPVTLPFGDFVLGGDTGQGSLLCTPSPLPHSTPRAGPAYLGHRGWSSLGCRSRLRLLVLTPCLC